MRRSAHFAHPLVLFSSLTLGLLAAGCSRTAQTPAPNKVPARNAASMPPAIDYAKIRPNELGYIPVIMYHEIGGRPVKSDPALVRPVASFQKDLDLMYAAHFRPVNLSDVIHNTINLPAGMSPVVLTFDDARESQFRLIETDKTLKIDPNCAVGILDAFHKKHPDWEMRATFFVLPHSPRTMATFGQPGLDSQKLSYLIEQGMEIGNHTTLHKDLSRMTPEQIQAEIGNAHNELMAAVPKARIEIVALPMGRFPRKKENRKYLVEGSYEGKPYAYKAVMAAAYRAIPSPMSKKFNPMALERIASRDDRWGVRWWIETLSQNTSQYPRYVSDGDPHFVSVPKGMENMVDMARLQAQHQVVNAYSPFGNGSGAKPIVGADAEAGSPAPPAPATTDTAQKPITGG